MADASGVTVLLSRQRTAQACEKCRSMKAKCNGQRPVCSRCAGYGFHCSYASVRRRPKKPLSKSQPVDLPGPYGTAKTPLTGLLSDCDNILRKFRNAIPESAESAEIEADLANLKFRLRTAFSETPAAIRIHKSLSTPGAAPNLAPIPARTRSVRLVHSPIHSGRYLGKVSDVSFYHLVSRKVFQHGNVDVDDDAMETYDQDDVIPLASVKDISLELPSPEVAEQYLDIYFTTIHVAYPFIPKSLFINTYRKLAGGADPEDFGTSWLALLYVVFAIGSYYTSFPATGPSNESLHERYFQRALALSDPTVFERSVIYLNFLLAQCFYLLTICKVDKCWTTLGIAIRIAHSIGLHTETSRSDILPTRALFRRERRRRLWYSLYVLDRLLALQLGRPPAIHENDCHVALPSRIDDAELDWDTEVFPAEPQGQNSIGDYFLCVIKFSSIVGLVLRDLYGVKKSLEDELMSTKRLDKFLLEWKKQLPRVLRFDISHAFEKSILFRRQRNMLAIKFHHLRALIHRPFLCLPFLVGEDTSSLSSLRADTQLEIRSNEKVCITEAQETAHLLHHVVDERNLVHDFPWWQMISCLICASSILLVAMKFARLNQTEGAGEELNEDAETCLKVFEALGANMDAARIARAMLEKLRDHIVPPDWINENLSQPVMAIPSQSNMQSLALNLDVRLPGSDYSFAGGSNRNVEVGAERSFESPRGWPSEIWDSMIWSAQFFDVGQNYAAP